MSLPAKQYLGDAVYVRVDELRRVVLTTEDGISATNEIILEPDVVVALVRYIERMVEGKS